MFMYISLFGNVSYKYIMQISVDYNLLFNFLLENLSDVL